MKASTFLKQMLATIVAAVKARSTAVRAKTSALRTRLLVLGILRNKKLLVAAINSKIHAIMGQDAGEGGGGKNKAVVLCTSPSYVAEQQVVDAEEEEDMDDYLTHSLFHDDGDDDELVTAPGSAIDAVRGATEGEGAEFRLEEQIDHVADVFIRRIHRQLKLQKLDSFKRFCEMMERSAA